MDYLTTLQSAWKHTQSAGTCKATRLWNGMKTQDSGLKTRVSIDDCVSSFSLSPGPGLGPAGSRSQWQTINAAYCCYLSHSTLSSLSLDYIVRIEVFFSHSTEVNSNRIVFPIKATDSVELLANCGKMYQKERRREGYRMRGSAVDFIMP